LMLIGSRYADRFPNKENAEPLTVGYFRPGTLLLTFASALIAVCSGPGFLYWQASRASALEADLFSSPISLPGWQRGAVSSGWSPNFIGSDARLAFSMREDGSAPLEVDVFVNYYSGQKGSRALLNGNNKIWAEDVWRSVSEGTAEAALGERHLTVRESVITSGGLIRLVWWTYWTGGHFTASGRGVKLESLRQVFSGRAGSAVIALSTSAARGLSEARVRLGLAFQALDGLNARLEQASKN
jgi:EpsI family protein